MTKTLLIFGSSRSDGGTMRAVNLVTEGESFEAVNLLEKNIGYYRYDNANQNDDFISVAEQMVAADVLVFATPVYWYAMSGVLKTFFDRFTDLITLRKDLGRALKGKKCYVISAGTQENLPEGFEAPFSATCKYMGMEYGGSFYFYTRTEEKLMHEATEKAKTFASRVFS